MKKNIALIAGGYSGEYEVSIKSGQQIAESIDKEKYEVFVIIIDKKKMYYVDETNKEFQIDKNDFSLTIDNQKITFDAVYNMIHGSPGEDGRMQGYFDLLGIPYTGCGMYSSAATFNKHYTKLIASAVGINTAKSVFLTRQDYDVDEIIEKLGLPCFVKPNKNGSSVGVSKVYEKEELCGAIEKAFSADDEVLIESFVKGREFACGIFRKDGINQVLPITEIISKNDFFDYEAKYTDGKNDEVTPADIDEETALTISAYTNLLYETLNCKGLIRIDYIADSDNVTMIEANTIPGMSAQSIVPKQLKHYGIDMKEFVNMQLDEIFNKK